MSFTFRHYFLSSTLPLTLAMVLICGSYHPQVAHADPSDVDDAFAEDDEDEFERWLPGLVAEYPDEQGRAVQSIARRLNLDPHRKDPLYQNGSVQWTGQLFTLIPGEYRLHFYLQGEVEVTVNDQVVLKTSAASPTWVVTEPITFDYGYHPFTATYQMQGERPLFKAHWEGPSFRLEPIPPTALFHDRAAAPESQLERGRELVDALNCRACHTINGTQEPDQAATLTHLSGNMHSSWLIDWIGQQRQTTVEPGKDGANSTSRMPSFDIAPADAQAMAAYFLRSHDSKSPLKAVTKGDVAEGEQLFLTIGCLACHDSTLDTPRGLYDGTPLANVAAKRPAAFFEQWLKDPAVLNANHRMPIFPLSDEERSNLAAYLATLANDAPQKSLEISSDLTDSELQERGHTLLIENRCNACHQLENDARSDTTLPPIALGESIDWASSCLAPADGDAHRPSYDLASTDKAAVEAFIEQEREHSYSTSKGTKLLTEQNCLACHSRDWEQGIADKLPALTAAHPKLAPDLPKLAPPSLTGIGDKLTAKALGQAITTQAPARRPWLSVRMPRFPLSEEERQTLVDHFISTDRIPDRTVASEEQPDGTALELAGRRLVTADGFGCTSCHQIGSVEPHQVALNARGTNLSLLGKHIRRTWFDRWVRNPAQIVPKMEMPSIQLAVHGVLEDSLDDQLDAVWHVLNQEGFEPPPPGALRIVRSTNTGDENERATVLTDVLRVGERQIIKPFLVGLPNRHSFLFDFEKQQLAGWWIGDTAAQRTEGKSWYWEASGTSVVPIEGTTCDIQLVQDDETVSPKAKGQFISEFDYFEHIPGGLRWGYRLQFQPPSRPSEQLLVTEELTEVEPDEGLTGFRRSLSIAGIPDGAAVQFNPLPGSYADDVEIDEQGTIARLATGQGLVELRVESHSGERFASPEDNALGVRVEGSTTGEAKLTLQYLTNLPVDQYFVPDLPEFPTEAIELDVVPGYEAVELPLISEAMPTGLAWRDDGSLVVSSLKGRVWIARDTDGDGLEDQMKPFSDELAAPYGVASSEPASIDCINKYALLRLWDRDGDGHAERTEVLASGWGHTADYHDWAVGLPKDPQGRYYVALPCQQDNRSPEAARLRGTAIRLTPKTPTSEDPQQYAIEIICAGLRFPMGLALSRTGDLFATDNQGNYNPFNELNWLVEGARYGFVNKLDRGKEIPAGSFSAIEIPHPWTRSVNGICFLDTPAELREKQAVPSFGPFEGHLLGCEYDTRRLIRMSLQKVDGEYQGAAYPFTRTPQEGEPALQGPLVCSVAPDGDIYVGSIRDSGWGGGTNVGSLARLRLAGELPPGIAEVRATATGFEIEFTAPVDATAGASAKNYHLESYRRKSTPAYGGDDMDRREEPLVSVTLSEDRRRANLELDELRPGFVYALRLSGFSQEFFPAEAYYTLRKVPASQ